MAEDVSATDLTGLSEAEATARLRVEGHNELPSPERRTPIRIALDVLREPMLALLLSGGLIYLLLGDLQEALLLLGFGAMSIVITIVQETRTERVLEALRDLTSPRALVMRDGVRRRIAGWDVVRGDLIILGDGDRVPADAVLLDDHDLQVDESLLTGESVPVRKQVVETDAVAEHRPGGDDQPFVYSGSLVVRGEAPPGSRPPDREARSEGSERLCARCKRSRHAFNSRQRGWCGFAFSAALRSSGRTWRWR